MLLRHIQIFCVHLMADKTFNVIAGCNPTQVETLHNRQF